MEGAWDKRSLISFSQTILVCMLLGQNLDQRPLIIGKWFERNKQKRFRLLCINLKSLDSIFASQPALGYCTNHSTLWWHNNMCLTRPCLGFRSTCVLSSAFVRLARICLGLRLTEGSSLAFVRLSGISPAYVWLSLLGPVFVQRRVLNSSFVRVRTFSLVK